MSPTEEPTYRHIARAAWPIILANSSVPLLGLADTAVIGNTGTISDLSAIALGALVFSFVYWGFGFLRMGTTGFTAQADGARDEPEVRAVLGRSLLLAVGLGVVLVALNWPISWIAFSALSGSPEAEALAESYFAIRIWGAPATLATFALNGTLIGLGKSRHLLAVQLFLNGTNIALDVLFAGGFGLGVEGIALGTAIAEWAGLSLALFLVLRLLAARRTDHELFWPRDRIRHADKALSAIRANADILIRTLALLFGFSWFVNQGARLGDVMLASNHILLQFMSFAAYFLDGFAFVAESLTGAALGAGNLRRFDLSVRRSSVLAGSTALALSLGLSLLGPTLIHALSDAPEVRSTARAFLPFATVYIAVSFAAFQLDGIFIGTTRSRQMRNAALAALAIFLLSSFILVRLAGNSGLWFSFIVYVLARAVALGAYYPALRLSVTASGRPPLNETAEPD